MKIIRSVDEYLEFAKDLDTMSADIYRYLNFNQIESFQKAAAQAVIPVVNVVDAA